MAEDPTKIPLTRESLPNRFLERFKNLRSIGRGAMGEVFLAEDSQLPRSVAIKTVRTAGAIDPELEANLRERFKKEAGAAARISHPNVVTVFDYAVEDGIQYIVMEYVDGRPLSKIISDEEPIEEQNALRILSKICAGIKAIHEAGIVHRDLKPSNIMCGTQEGVVKIMDLGIARLEGSDMTRTGLIIGTLNYMSPEQAQGQRVTRASDIFSIGCIAYELITREKAFPGRSATSVLYRIANEDPVPPTNINPTLPKFWDNFIIKCLEKNPDRRFKDCDEILSALAAHNPSRELKPPDETDITGAVQHARRTAAVKSATEAVLESPWMTGEVYWASSILTLGISSLTLPYLLIKDFTTALSEQFENDEKHGPLAISISLNGLRGIQIFGSWGLAGLGVIAGIVFLLLALNIDLGSVATVKESAKHAGYWLIASEVGLFSGWILLLLWFYHTSKDLHRSLVHFRAPNSKDDARERSRMFGRIYYFIIEGGMVMLAIGIHIPRMFDYLVKTNIHRIFVAPSASIPAYLLELSLLSLVAILLVYFAHGYVRYVTCMLLFRVVLDEELGRSWKLAFGASRIFCGVFILTIPFYLYRDGLLGVLERLVQ